MRRPAPPPPLDEILGEFGESSALGDRALYGQLSGRDRTYLPWDDLRRRQPPDGLTIEQWWAVVRLGRQMQSRRLPLLGVDGEPFAYVVTDALAAACHDVDRRAGGLVASDERLLNHETRDRYVFASLVEEALSSSQIEGAVTTRRVAKEMIRTGRLPHSKAERMVLNNYLAMERVRELKAEPLTVEAILGLHRIVTEGTLNDSASEGRLRTLDDVLVTDVESDEPLHVPPKAAALPKRIHALCDFANARTPDFFVHPLIRAMVLHFWLAYDHPFEDGNGRTARALFYWSVLRQGYWLFEFLPISHVIHRTRRRYYRAFLLTEDDDGDVTYFLLYHLEAIQESLKLLEEYLARKTDEVRRVESTMRESAVLNHRQQALIAHALRHPGEEYTFESHRRSHGVTYQTARTDVMDLEAKGVLVRRKRGRAFVFRSVDDLEAALRRL